MFKLPFTPRAFPTVFTIIALIILICLGTWQVQRLQWKNHLITQITEKGKADPVLYQGQLLDIAKDQYRLFILKGRYDYTRERHLYTGPKVMRGEPGYNLLTPMVLDSGQVVLVDRGWITHSKKQQKLRPETLPEGEVQVEAMLHRGEHPSAFTLDSDPKANVWLWIDVPAMLADKAAQPVYFRVLKTEGESTPLIRGDRTIEKRNDHLEYAITWYSLAIILVVIYVLYHLGLVREEKVLAERRKEKE